MTKIYDAALVFQAIAKQTLNGSVVVFHDTPRNGLTQETINTQAFQVLKTVNATRVIERIAIHRQGGMFDMIILEDGFLKVGGWLQNNTIAKNITVASPITQEAILGAAPTEKNPNPTKTYWCSAIVQHDGISYAVLFETRGFPVDEMNIQECMPQGMFFLDVDSMKDFVQARQLYLTEVSDKNPVSGSLRYAQLGYSPEQQQQAA